jgi:RNA polymerase sigma factor (sigma-70 family)
MGEMQEQSDAQLLREYAERGGEPAFREIVTRHADLVYSAALRCVNSSDLACDIAQSVFTDLSRKARPLADKLADNASLVGWLYRSTRFAALNQLRDDRRRLAHERQAMEQLLSNSETAPDWDRIRPVLDEAMDNLKDEDRDALLLRYFKNHDFHDVGRALGVSDDTAQKRVSRAVEHLREFLSKRGVTVGTSGLVVVITANAVQAAPAGLAVTISTAAVLAGTTFATTATATATKIIAMTTLQKTLITATLAVVAGAGIYEARQASTLRTQVQTLQQQQAPLNEQIQQLQHERDDATNRLAMLAGEMAETKSNSAELLKLRGQMTQLRNETEIENDPAFQKARLWMAKELKLRQQFEQHPDQWIPEMKFLSSEEWLDQARKADLDTATGMRCALSNVRVVAVFKFGGKISEALRAYLIAHNQQLPDSISQLSAYFHPPVEDADAILSRYEMLNSEEQANPAFQGAVIIQKTLVDHIDNAILINSQRISSVPPPSWPAGIPDELKPVAKSYIDANDRGFLSIYDLEPYATTPAEKEALNKFIKAATTVH